MCTCELLYRSAPLAYTNICVSHHCESVELTTAQVQEGTAALGGVTGGVHT